MRPGETRGTAGPDGPSPLEAQAALGLGGNLGDVRAAFARALAALAAEPGIELVRKSSLYRTRPWGPVAQPPFLNMVVLVRTALTPHQLLDVCLAIERQEGRVRGERFGPRTLDVDILVFGELVLSDARLTLPHTRLLERAFVLVPLAEIAPGLVIGGVGIAAALKGLDRTGVEKLAG